jgi:hypothetical protein
MISKVQRVEQLSSNGVDMKLVALDTLNAVESPLELFFKKEPPPLPVITQQPTPPPDVATPLIARSGRGSRSTRPRLSAPSVKILFIRNAIPTVAGTSSGTTTPATTVAKLVCTDCGRSDFPTMQGLLNHCRLRHHRAYGSHDECIQACAVPVSDDTERAFVLANGIEIAAGFQISLPSLKRIFERAVGNSEENPFSSSTTEKSSVLALPNASQETPTAVTPTDTISHSTSTYISRTLGHHKDTPALAPFLGTTARRRGINVYDQDEEIDIGELMSPSTRNGCHSASSSSWRMAFLRRGEILSESSPSTLDDAGPSPLTQHIRFSAEETPPRLVDGSRFHILARVSVADRSQWISPGELRYLLLGIFNWSSLTCNREKASRTP